MQLPGQFRRSQDLSGKRFCIPATVRTHAAKPDSLAANNRLRRGISTGGKFFCDSEKKLDSD